MATIMKKQAAKTAIRVIKTKKQYKFQGYPCGDYKWVEIHSDKIADYDLPNCIKCTNHGKQMVYRHPFFVHSEHGEYECPNGSCSGDVKYICRICNNLHC
jgi:hypothetical protein